jgi:hypothetical protein
VQGETLVPARVPRAKAKQNGHEHQSCLWDCVMAEREMRDWRNFHWQITLTRIIG